VPAAYFQADGRSKKLYENLCPYAFTSQAFDILLSGKHLPHSGYPALGLVRSPALEIF